MIGQRLMQAPSGIFLGWTSYRENEHYVRQYRDMKGSVSLDAMTLSGLASYAQVCGRTLRPRTIGRRGDDLGLHGPRNAVRGLGNRLPRRMPIRWLRITARWSKPPSPGG